jgi:hypothetical protein
MTISFLIPGLLFGALLVAVPIVIHLIMRRKPKHLLFPAVRFLRQRYRTTVQKLRLRHILLLVMRMLLILLLAGALARPLLLGGPDELSVDAAVAAVLIFDTSPSMEYQHEGQTRLAAAQAQAAKFLERLPADSDVAVMDTAEPGAQFVKVRDALLQVKNRQIRPRNRPVTDSLREAYRFIEQAKIDKPLLVCIFSDRTGASWSAEAVAADLLPARGRLEKLFGAPPPCVYLDLSAPEPRNVAITGLSVKLENSTAGTSLEGLLYGVPLKGRMQLQASVQVTGTRVSTELLLFVDGRQVDAKSLDVTAQPGQTVADVVTFEPIAMTEAVLQGEVRLRGGDALDADNVRYWTLVAPQRRVLIIADHSAEARFWRDALESVRRLPMSCVVVTPKEVPATLTPDQYQAVCLMNVANPSAALWANLRQYVAAGGGLVIVPGDEVREEAYWTAEAQAVMPARLVRIRDDVPPAGAFWVPENFDHPILRPFQEWERQTLPGRVYRLWEVAVDRGTGWTVVSYNWQGLPALVERVSDPQEVRGRVVLFTTAMSRHDDAGGKKWNNYFDSNWLGLALPYVTTRHVLGAREERTNYLLRESVRFWLPRDPGFSAYVLTGPDEARGEIKPGALQVVIDEARQPGNYTAADPHGGAWQRHFSLNLPADETRLATERPGVSDIEALLGPRTVFTAGEAPNLRELARAKLGQAPRSELLPYLMIGVLFILLGESLLANRFYRQEPTEEPA